MNLYISTHHDWHNDDVIRIDGWKRVRIRKVLKFMVIDLFITLSMIEPFRERSDDGSMTRQSVERRDNEEPVNFSSVVWK